MKAFNQGSYIKVTADQYDLTRFANVWPGSGINHGDRMSATFSKSNGDLVDIYVSNEFDGGAGVALVEDLKTYAIKRGLL